MARQRRRRDPDDDDLDADPPIRRRGRPRWRRRFLFFVLIVAVAAVAAPTIIAKTPLRNLLLSSALPPGVGQLASTDGVFSWTGGQALAGVTLADAEGRPLAQIESATIDRSLVALAANRRHLGKIVVTRPVVTLETRAGGSNLEDLVARLAEAAKASVDQSPAAAVAPTLAEIEIVEATILGRDAATGQHWRIDQLNATARPADAEAKAWEANGTGILTLADSSTPSSSEASLGVPAPSQLAVPAPGAAGRFKFQLKPANPHGQQLHLLADRIPLAPLEPWLARVLPNARILGTSSADLNLTWTPPPAPAASASPSDLQPPVSSLQSSFSAAGRIDAVDLRFTADALSNDLVELRSATLSIDAALADARLAAKQLTLRSDWLQAEATGEFDLDQFTRLSAEQLPATDASLTVRVDLPQLTRMLPRTLQLRPGVRIDSGNVELTARSSREDTGRRWTLAAAVEDLAGHDGKRPIRWTQPVEAGVDFAEAPAGPQLQRILVRSPFASLSAEGAAGGLEGDLQFNLDELAAQLGQFVDLSAWQLHGTGQGKFSWRDTGPDKFAASAGLDLTQIDVRRDGRVVWADSKLHVELQSSGVRLAARPLRIDTATALMRGASDSIEAELLEPVDLAAADRDWFVRIKGDGPLDSWAGRLRPWVAAVPAELAGQTNLSARLRLSANLIEVVQSQLSVTDLRTRLGGAEFIEPRVEASGDFRWDAAARAIDSQDAQFTSSTIAARARGLSLRLTDAGPPTVRGDVAFRGDLERLAAWAGMAGEGLWPRGQVVGRVQLATSADRASANLTLAAEPFTLVRATAGAPPTAAWHEPNLQLATELTYAHADDRLQLANLRLDGQTVKLTGGGAVEQLRTAALVRGEATLTYDSAELAKLLTTYLGPGVRIQTATPIRLTASGRLSSGLVPAPSPSRGGLGRGGEAGASVITTSQTPPHQGEGNGSNGHWSRRWTVTADAGFAAANLYGLPIGQTQLIANARDGQIQINPLDLAVGQGRLTLQPRVLLDPPPQQFQLAAGPLVSNVAVSAEVSDAMLKYAAPILANATRISGTFSLFSEGVSVPLDDPKKAAAKGRVTMHELAILPGPGLADVVTLIQRLEQLSRRRPEDLLGVLAQPAGPVKGITMTERTIDVQVVDGRVYHRNLEFLIDDVPVRSYGSVGFDQSIALVIQVPVQAKWVGKEPALQRLIGQVIEIPVSGTFTRWKVDERAVGAFLAQAAQTAVGGAIGDELNKALEGLFRKK